MSFASELENAQVGRKSGQKVANNSGGLSTASGLQALKRRVRADTLRYFKRAEVPHYLIRLKCADERGHFALSADLDEAAKKARELKLHLSLHGWEKTVEAFPPLGHKKPTTVTVGEFLELVKQHGQIDPKTYYSYSIKFRQVVGGVVGFRHKGGEKNRGRRGISAWRIAVDAVPMAKITPTKVELWRSEYLAHRVSAAKAEEKAGGNENSSVQSVRKCAEHTVNSVVRGARSLFAAHTLKRVRNCVPSLRLPAPLPFEGVDLLEEHDADFFYISEIDAGVLVRKALAELTGDVLVIFVLAIGSGLRRSEIDNLKWAHVDLERGTILVAPTVTSDLKSDSSLGEVHVEPKLLEILRAHAKTAKGDYVLRSDVRPRGVASYSFYRCAKEFTRLCEWLAAQGIRRERKKLHALRKEFGSNITQAQGIHAACASLRHSSIALTAKYYAKRKGVPTSFFAEVGSATSKTKEKDADAIVDALLKRMVEQGLVMRSTAA